MRFELHTYYQEYLPVYIRHWMKNSAHTPTASRRVWKIPPNRRNELKNRHRPPFPPSSSLSRVVMGICKMKVQKAAPKVLPTNYVEKR